MNNIVNEINQRLKTILNDYPKSKVKEAMLYSLQAGGKRIRPFIVLQVIRAYNQNYHDQKLNTYLSFCYLIVLLKHQYFQ